MSDCSKHKKDICGISDMKVLAEMIGDLHYETLTYFLTELSIKVWNDGLKDKRAGRTRLGNTLLDLSTKINSAAYKCNDAWRLSKPHMENKNR